MRESNTPSNHLGSGLILFALTASMALLLLVSALTVYLSQVMGSLIGAMLLLGVVFGAVAAATYYFTLHDAFRQLQSRLETVYDVALAAQWGYEKVIGFLQKKVFL